MRLFLLLALLVAAPVCWAGEAEDPVGIVRDLTTAFNAHDVDAMLALTSDDIQWLSIVSDAVVVEVAGHEALRKSMEGYFATTPSVRSTIEGSLVSGPYVVVQERAAWQGAEGKKSQSSLAVYELEGAKIRRVWYFPAQP